MKRAGELSRSSNQDLSSRILKVHPRIVPCLVKNALDNLARENNVLSIERRVVDILEKSSEPIHVDDITRALGEAPAAVSSVLVMLELQGTARQVGSMQFIADRERPVVSP